MGERPFVWHFVEVVGIGV